MNKINLNTQSFMTMGIRARLFAGFAILGIIFLIFTLYAFIKISNTKNFANNVISIELPTYDFSYDINLKLHDAQLALTRWMLSKNDEEKKIINNSWNLIDKLKSNINTLSSKWENSANIQSWLKITGLINQLQATQEKILNSDNPTKNTMLMHDTEVLFNQILDAIDGPLDASGDRSGGMFDLTNKNIQKNTSIIIKDMDSLRLMELALFIFIILFSFIIAVYTMRRIVSYINLYREHSSKVASGDLTKRIDIIGNDELSLLGNDLNTMTESLANVTKKITEVSQHMVAAITEVKHAVEVQSSGASEQASSINEITASLEEIEKSSNQTIEKAKTLGEVALRTREKGQMGLEAVEQSVVGMKAVRDKVQVIAQTILDLSNQTQQVGEITAVVNKLAQQSKMLALNASIEAAKAGEAGKGFAVVASEVKNLAEQSEESTTQVQKILEDIRRATEKAVMATEEGTKGVDYGTGLVEQTGETVRSLSDVIHETTIASQQIEAAIRQEGLGIEQITAGMNEINQVTASFVESVSQTTEAISNLAEMVQNIKQYIDVYKI